MTIKIDREVDTFEAFQQPERGRFGDGEARQKERGYFPGQDGGFPRVRDRRGPPEAKDVAVSRLLHRQSDKAVLVSDNGSDSRGVWLPKSLIKKIENTGAPITRYGHPLQPVTVTLPEWKAKQAGLI